MVANIGMVFVSAIIINENYPTTNINIAADSFIAAGSTITDDTQKFDMAIARARQTNKADYAKKLPW